jgi:hypothetical protein
MIWANPATPEGESATLVLLKKATSGAGAWPTANKLSGVASKTHEALPGTWAFPGALDNGRIGLGWHESVGNSDSLL